ncbi:hypothetical protein ACQU0X_22230 [Pseudovibrio ascidiaceicola]|uniref:hypothetical protein n=1 Tax=Pseudovibrio ascidiaceicola TaxID=285279 RepID=UPI003D35C485
MRKAQKNKALDRSDAADANRLRWLLENPSFIKEEHLAGTPPLSKEGKDNMRHRIDLEMNFDFDIYEDL